MKAKPADRAVNADVTPELMERLERSYGARIRRAQADAERDALNSKWRPWEGTPETNERIERVPRHRRQWPLDRMLKAGKIDHDEHLAAQEIAWVIELIERAVSIRSVSLEARVDCSGSARDALVESLGRVRLEIAYRTWRDLLPKPPRMFIEMIITNRSYVSLAARYRVNWRQARKQLISALRRWDDCKRAARTMVGREEVEAVYAKIGEGALLAPIPKVARTSDDD